MNKVCRLTNRKVHFGYEGQFFIDKNSIFIYYVFSLCSREHFIIICKKPFFGIKDTTADNLHFL